MRVSRKNRFVLVVILILLMNYIWSYHYILSNTTQNVSNIITKKVNPIGKNIGLKLYTNGVLVVGMSEVESSDGHMYKPYEHTGIEIGDMIKSINGKEIKNVNDLIGIVNDSCGNELSVRYQRSKDEVYTTLSPVRASDGNYMLGLWVRDAAAGIGTITYYDESNSRFAALGHGIEDIDTGNLLNISNGEIVTSKIISIVKGKPNKPGEIRGTIDEGKTIGSIQKNTELGVYGTVTDKDFIDSIKMDEVSVASRNEIKIGKAKIYCELFDGNVGEYEIEIKKIYKSNSKDNKSMLIKVTDKSLLEITGGIIPGMSGTPIIQDDKFVGAITNVLVSNPEEGYAIFADMMIEQ